MDCVTNARPFTANALVEPCGTGSPPTIRRLMWFLSCEGDTNGEVLRYGEPMGANPAGARLSVAPMMIIKNINVRTTSTVSAAINP